MADVEMPDAGASAPAKSKAIKTSKAGTAGDSGLDGKKRFEVKKVYTQMRGRSWQEETDRS